APDGARPAERGERARRTHVVGEHEEGRAVRHEAAVQGEAVHRRAHGVLADAEVEVPSLGTPRAAHASLGAVRGQGTGLEVALLLEPGERRRVEIPGAPA